MFRKALFILCLPLLIAGCNRPGKSGENTEEQSPKKAMREAFVSFQSFRKDVYRSVVCAMCFVQIAGASEKKDDLAAFTNTSYAKEKAKLKKLCRAAGDDAEEACVDLLAQTDKMVEVYKTILSTLNSIQKYDDPMAVFPMRNNVLLEEGDLQRSFAAFEKEATRLDKIFAESFN